jgi:hypothetical protein
MGEPAVEFAVFVPSLHHGPIPFNLSADLAGDFATWCAEAVKSLWARDFCLE